MFVYSFIVSLLLAVLSQVLPQTQLHAFFYSNCAGSEELAVDMLLQKSHFVNCCWSQAFFLVSETKRKFLARNSSRTKVFLPEKKVFFTVSAAAASFPRWLT